MAETTDVLRRLLAAAVTDLLTPAGWASNPASPGGILRLARPYGDDGLITVAGIGQQSFSSHGEGPLTFGLDVGVGYQPGWDLMPLLTLDPDPLLLDASADRAWPEVLSVADRNAVPQMAARLAAEVRERSTTVAATYPDLETLVAGLRAEADAQRAAVDGDDQDTWRREITLRGLLVTLLAAGRHDEARDVLTGYRDDPQLDGHRDADRDRFVRQVDRWLTDPRPIPPLAQTMALLPRDRWTAHTSRGPRQRPDRRPVNEANVEVRRQAAGRTAVELRALITAAYLTHDLPITPVGAAIAADAFLAEREPFGRARNAVRLVRLAAQAWRIPLSDFDPDDQGPARPPPRACFSYPDRSDAASEITLDPDMASRLPEVAAAARQAGPLSMPPVWLTRSAGVVTVHSGQQALGHIPAADASLFDDIFTAAALFDEDPTTHARLYTSEHGSPPVLELPWPDPVGPPSSGGHDA